MYDLDQIVNGFTPDLAHSIDQQLLVLVQEAGQRIQVLEQQVEELRNRKPQYVDPPRYA